MCAAERWRFADGNSSASRFDSEPRGGGGPCNLAFFVALLVAVALACGGLAMLNVRQAQGQWPFEAATPEEAVEVLE